MLFQFGRDCTDTSLPIHKQDTLLEDANAGVLWLADMASRYSFPAQAAPANGSAVINMDETGNDGSIVIQSGNSVAYAGGGLDFTGTTKSGNYLVGPAAAAASIWGSANQYFIVCAYVKLPSAADWNSDSTLHEMLKFSAAGSAGVYTSVPELLLIAQSAPDGAISFRRQKAAASADLLGVTANAGDFGSVVQLAFVRDATGQYARLRSPNGTALDSAAVSTNNTQNFSALTPKVGVPGGFDGQAVGGTMTTVHQVANNMRVYRAWIENLAVSGRDAMTVLNADYTRTMTRGVFS